MDGQTFKVCACVVVCVWVLMVVFVCLLVLMKSNNYMDQALGYLYKNIVLLLILLSINYMIQNYDVLTYVIKA